MSLSGISLSSLPPTNQSQSPFQQFTTEFRQLGQDLQAGNLTQAQQDFVTLTQDAPKGQSNSTVTQLFTQLGQDLQAGNLTGAQQDYSTLHQDLQGVFANRVRPHQHTEPPTQGGAGQTQPPTQGGAGQTEPPTQGGAGPNSSLAQEFNVLGQALQSGNLSAAQQAYTIIAQDFQGFSSSSGAASSSTQNQATTGSTNVTA